MDIPEVKSFNSELSGLYDNKPPISKAKMSAITRGAVKAIKFYKHVVHSVEKFIQKCKPEYKIPGLYVIDSIVRQSRHQFGTDKDVFAPRFAKNLQNTFINLLRCPPEDKRNIIRVLNLWQKNSVFSAEVIQPLFDMVNPNHPIHQEILAQSNNANGSLNSSLHIDPRTTPGAPHGSQHTPDADQGKSESIYSQIRQALRDNTQSGSQATDKQSTNFNRRLLNVDFEYESEDEGTGEKNTNVNVTATQITASDAQQQQTSSSGLLASTLSQLQQQAAPSAQQSLQHNYVVNPLLVHNNPTDSLNNIGSMLANPEILRHLQNLQAAQMMVTNFPQLQGMNNLNLQQDMSYFDMTQPPPGFHNKDDAGQLGASGTGAAANNSSGAGKPKSPLMDEVNNESDIEFVDDAGPQVIEIDGNDSRSPSPKSIRRRRSRSRDRRRSRSRSRSRRFSRSRSRDRRSRRSRDRDRDRDRDRSTKERGRDREREKERDKEKEKEREKERERKKKGLPPMKKEMLSVCSTTLWVGHLSKLVQAEDLSDTFGPIGEVLSIDLVSPRGCAFIVMNRRRDAYRALIKLEKHKIHNKSITVAWAPGKGMKGREWKDYWEADSGASYVPWDKLPRPGATNATQLLEAMEDGGMLDDETLPPWLHRKGSDVKPVLPDVTALTHPLLAAANTAAGMMVVPPLGQATAPKLGVGVDASHLPAPLGPLGFPPHPALPLPLLPLQAFKPQPQPAGLQQALHLQAMLAQQQQHQQQLAAAQLLLGPPPRLPVPPATLTHPPAISTVQQPLSSITSETQKDDPMEIDNADDTPAQEINSKDNTPFSSGDNVIMSDKMKNLISQPPPVFNIPPPMMGQMPPNTSIPPAHIIPPNTSRMPLMPPRLNTSHPPPLFDKQNSGNNNANSINSSGGIWDQQQSRGDSKERDRDRRDRDGGRRDRDRDRRDRDGGRRDRHDRDRDGHRDRDRGDMDRDRDRNRERDRDRPDRERGRDKVSRWRDNSRERSDGGPMAPGGERSLQDRLWEMANGPGARPRSDQSPPPSQHRSRERSRPKDGPPVEGLLGEAPMGMSRALSPSSGPSILGRSPLLPHMAPFRIGRDDIRMRGMGPRGPMGSMRPGVWMDGPNPQFGPRFGGGPPPFNRPPFDGPPFEGPSYRDGMDGPPFNGIKSRFERPPFDREFDRPFDRDYDRQPYDGRPSFDGMGRPPFDEPRRPPFDRPGFEEPYDDRPPFDGPPRFNRSPYDDHDMDRAGPPRPVVPPRGLRSEREGRKRDGERISRWAVKESPEKQEEPPSEDKKEQTNKVVEEKLVQSVKPSDEMVVVEKNTSMDDNREDSKEVTAEKDETPSVPKATDTESAHVSKSDGIVPEYTEPVEVAVQEDINVANQSSCNSSEISKIEIKTPTPPPVVIDMFSDEPVHEPVIRNASPEPVTVSRVEPTVADETEPNQPSNVVPEHKPQEIVAPPPEISIGTPAQRKFYEPIETTHKSFEPEQQSIVDDENKFNSSPSPPPPAFVESVPPKDLNSKEIDFVSSPVREDTREEFNQSVVLDKPSSVVVNTQREEFSEINTNISEAIIEDKPQPVIVQAVAVEPVKETIPDMDGNKSQEGRSTPCRDEPSPASVSESTEQTNP